MLIAIPTYGRSDAQRTLRSIPERWLPNVWLVVQQRENHLYQSPRGVGVHVLPPHIQSIAPTRDWIVARAAELGEKLLMLDDDLDFAVRREDDPTKFRAAEQTDVGLMLSKISAMLNEYAHVGMSAREGANRNPSYHLHCTRMMRVLGYQPDVLLQHNIQFDRGAGLMEDFYVTLRLLSMGYPNILINSMVHNQPGSNVGGGCSEFRTPERQQAAAEALAAAFPDFVTVVKKQTKSSWNGAERYDVRILWKRAYESSGKSTASEILDGRAGADTAAED